MSYTIVVMNDRGDEVYSQIFTKLDVKRLIKEINDAYWTDVEREAEKPETILKAIKKENEKYRKGLEEEKHGDN